LGAPVAGLVLLLTRKFVLLVVVSFAIACPVAYWTITQWLNHFAYRTTPGIEIFALTGLLALGVTFVTVSSHAIKAALVNPVESLRYE
jgi:putative ABC transport system permease protein